MSLITRCPACQTLFKVVPDQLRISEGWVRCGQCDEIFDASTHMVQSLAPVSVATAPQNAMALPEYVLPMPEALAASTRDSDAVAIASSLTEDLSAAEEPFESLSADQALSSPDQPANVPEQAEQVQTAPLVRGAHGDLEPDSHLDSNDVSFLRHAHTPAAGPSLFMRATWAFLSLALVLGLAGQIILHERDRIAASQPDLQPWLQVMCDRLNCKLSAWRKIESVAIDSSAFTRIRDDSYRLSLTLKNMATVPVALPALELTLTDTLDQPVVRRVLILSEIDSKSDSIAAGLERPVSLTVAVNPAGGVDRIAGYRLLAFYP